MVEWLTSLISRRDGGPPAGGRGGEVVVAGPGGCGVDIGFRARSGKRADAPGHAARVHQVFRPSGPVLLPRSAIRLDVRQGGVKQIGGFPRSGAARPAPPTGGHGSSGNGETRVATFNPWWQRVHALANLATPERELA